MQLSIKPTLVSVTALLMLSACGGAPSQDTGTDPVVAPSYETLNSTKDVTSILGGTATQYNRTQKTVKLVTITGTLEHGTGETRIDVDNGAYVFVDLDGPEAVTGALSDGSATFEVYPASVNYQYAVMYDMKHSVSGDEYFSVGIGGIITSASDIPTAATAIYTGAAAAQVYTNSLTEAVRLSNGTSTVNVDFSGKTVDVTMTNFTPIAYVTGAPLVSPIDTITITGMTISGNAFSGGTLTTTNGGATVEIGGSDAVFGAGGNFFGYDNTTSRPAEVGGVISQDGTDGYITGVFIAK